MSNSWFDTLGVFDLETTGIDVETSRIVSAHVGVLNSVGELVEDDRRDEDQEVDDLRAVDPVGPQQDGDQGHRHHHDDDGALVGLEPAPGRPRTAAVASEGHQ